MPNGFFLTKLQTEMNIQTKFQYSMSTNSRDKLAKKSCNFKCSNLVTNHCQSIVKGQYASNAITFNLNLQLSNSRSINVNLFPFCKPDIRVVYNFNSLHRSMRFEMNEMYSYIVNYIDVNLCNAINVSRYSHNPKLETSYGIKITL